MILVDRAQGSKELKSLIRAYGVMCDDTSLGELGDVCFEGHGPRGTIGIGIERKRLHDMLHCIDDARYNRQRVDMAQLYGKCFLMLEGHWKAHEDGTLMEGFNGGTKWAPCRYRSQTNQYSKLYNYLVSVSLSGVHVSYSRDINHTVFNTICLYRYFQKKWTDHTSLQEVQKLAIPAMMGRPSVTRKWATDLDGIGVKYSQEAERLFKFPLALALGEVEEWLSIPGLGYKTASDIVKEIRGWK